MHSLARKRREGESDEMEEGGYEPIEGEDGGDTRGRAVTGIYIGANTANSQAC